MTSDERACQIAALGQGGYISKHVRGARPGVHVFRQGNVCRVKHYAWPNGGTAVISLPTWRDRLSSAT